MIDQRPGKYNGKASIGPASHLGRHLGRPLNELKATGISELPGPASLWTYIPTWDTLFL